MLKFPQASLSRYVIALLTVASALIVTLLLGTTTIPQPTVLFLTAVMLFLVAVMISAWHGGLRPGLLALVSSALAIGYLFLPKVSSPTAGLSDALRIALLLVVGAPITLIGAARKRAEEALRESEELHRITLNNISDAVFITDKKGVFTYVCPNANVIFGYSQAEVEAFGNISRLLGEGWFDPQKLKTEGEITNIEREITDKAGTRHVTLVNVKRVSIREGPYSTLAATSPSASGRRKNMPSVSASKRRGPKQKRRTAPRMSSSP